MQNIETSLKDDPNDSSKSSWQDWIESITMTGMNAVAIAGLTTGHLWAFTRDFSLDLFELKALSQCLLDSQPGDLPPQRIRLGHSDVWQIEDFQPPQYLLARYDELGIIAAPTHSALIVARFFFSDEMTSEIAIKIILRYASEIKKYDS